MAIYDFFVSRNNAVSNTAAYIGHLGRLFYDSDNGVIKISDGTTPGGVFIPYNIATTTTIGGIKAGAGANVSVDGTLTIDTSGLPLSIGNLQIEDTTIKTLEDNRDLYVVSNGTGNVALIGEIHFYKPNGFPPTQEPFFRAKNDGQLRILVPVEDPIEGGVEIIGSASGNYISPGSPGTMLQLTGNPGTATRIYVDGNANYASFVARRFNGNVASPTQVLANQDVLRINATAATDAGVGNVALAQIQFRALEDQTTTTQGSTINFIVTPLGSPASSRVEVANVTVANGVTATRATVLGNLTVQGNLIGNAVTTTATIGTANVATLNVSGSASITGNVVSGNVAGTKGTFTTFTGKYTRTVRDAGVIADGGTLTINFATDAIVRCEWGNGLTLAYSNYTAGSVVKLIAYKTAGTGTDSLDLGGITAGHVSSGSTTIGGTADLTTFVEFTCIGTTIGTVYAKI